MSRKDRILVFLFFCIYLKRLEVEIEMVNGYPWRKYEHVSRGTRLSHPRKGGNLCGSLVSLPSVTSVSIPFPSFLLSVREAAGRRMYALRRRGINKKTAAERRALRCLRDSWKKSFVADAADRRDAFLRGHRPPFFSPSPFSTSPRSFCNGGFLAEARNTRPLRHISTINGVSMRGKLFEVATIQIISYVFFFLTFSNYPIGIYHKMGMFRCRVNFVIFCHLDKFDQYNSLEFESLYFFFFIKFSQIEGFSICPSAVYKYFLKNWSIENSSGRKGLIESFNWKTNDEAVFQESPR